MLFNSIAFFVFFPCVFLLYYALPFRFRKYMLLAASYYFYMCWKPEFIVLILLSTVIDYGCGLGMARQKENPQARKLLLALSLVMNLGLLFFFKYFNFFGETLTALCRAVSIPFSAPVLDIILPVGISFYTFQTLSYTIDVYRGQLEPERDFVTFALFVSFFPQLVAGPIEKASNLLPQLKVEHPFTYENGAYGLKLMAWGFFKKCVIADRLAVLFVDPVYENLSAYSGGALIAATAAFALQIYCDFSGYSDIARGCAKAMGIDLMVNFRAPYLASSVQDFWRRHHISLTSWFREYVYIPLGGNRKGLAKTCLFTMITFFLSGLWHGAAWTFVAWGLLHGVLLSLERICHHRSSRRLPRVFGMPITFCVTSFAWIFFRANSMADALYAVRHLFVGITSPLQYCKNTFWALYPGEVLSAAVLLPLVIMLIFDALNEKGDTIERVSALPAWLRWPLYVGFLLVLVLLIPKETVAPFIYFQF